MSSTYGPYALTAGQRQQVNLGGTPGTIRISNQSTSLDLFVSFASVPPTSNVAGGDWDLVVHAGWAESVPLTDASLTPYALGKAWQGYLWVMPISNAAQLAQTGTVPSLANVYVTTYDPGEPAPNSSSPGPIAVSSSSQQRVVVVPLVPDVFASSFTSTPLAPNAVLDIVNVSFTPTGDTVAASWVHAMLYALACYPFASSTYETALALGCFATDNNGVTISSPSFGILHNGAFGYDTTAKIGHGLQWASDKPFSAKLAISPLNAPTPFTMHFSLKNVGGVAIPGMSWNFTGGVVPNYGYKNLVPPILGGWTGAAAVVGGPVY